MTHPILYVTFFCLTAYSCTPKKHTNVPIKTNSNVSLDSTIEDSKANKAELVLINTANDSAFSDGVSTAKASTKDFIIYPGGTFISIGTNPVPQVIEQKYLNARISEDQNHILNTKNRKTFFEAANLSETDTLYYYIFGQESIIKYTLSSLDLSAFLSPYEEPYNDVRSYFIGFNIPESQHYDHSLVFIGKQNPFVIGAIEPIIWSKINRSEFPNIECRYDTLDIATEYVDTPFANLAFEAKGLQYYLCIVDASGQNNHLVVIDSTSNEIVFDRVFTLIEEDYMPLDIIGNKKYHYPQWTGKLFKNMPIALYGFTPSMFGCPEIQFIDKNTEDILINCDNRH